jgi:hypothetical protein
MLLRGLPQFNRFERSGLMSQDKMRVPARPIGFRRVHHYAFSLTKM